MRETPLKDVHIGLGARMVDFAGWYMPVTYTSIKEEHNRVRTAAGLFDVSHMGRYNLVGPDHVKFADMLLTNRRGDMASGQIRYSLICNDEGMILDDVLCYSLGDIATSLVVNAGNREKIANWIKAKIGGFNATFEDHSNESGMIALQGPKADKIMSKLTDADLKGLKYYHFVPAEVAGEKVILSRTGYTGERGFELVMPAPLAVKVWGAIMAAGEEFGVGPAGLGARDTLRLEAGMPLYGHEIDDQTNPLEAGLDWAVKLDKDDFYGKGPTAALKEAGIKARVVGLNVDGKRIPREGQEVLAGGETVGKVCSGTMAPWLDRVIATARVPARYAETGTRLEVQLKPGKTLEAEVTPLPFYTRKKKAKA